MPAPARLVDQVHGLSHDGAVVITVQHWRTGSTHALLVFRNGERVSRRASTERSIAGELARARTALTPTGLDDTAARARIAALTGWTTETPCTRCGGCLPVGGYRCTRCDLSVGRSAAGSVTSAPVIDVRMQRHPHEGTGQLDPIRTNG